jgi:hypothetical protein
MRPIDLTPSRMNCCSAATRAAAIRHGCTVYEGPLLLAACLGANPNGPAQRVYLCAACDHLEWGN